MRVLNLPCLLSLVVAVTAQQSVWQQCGGMGWTGGTTCVAGTYCFYSNPWYSQCLPGNGPSSSTTTTSAATTRTTTSLTTSTIRTSTSTTRTTTSSSASSSPSTIGSYAKASGNVFTINGKKTYFMGTNTYWIGFLTNNADVDLVMSHLAATGLKVLRVWGFNDVTSTPGQGTVWYQSFVPGQSPVINTGANGLQRLDYVVKSAEAHGISLIINFVNNWTDYGGMAAYVSYYGGTTTGWYTSSAIQTQYKKYIEAVVSRYKTSTAIFAWELANEPRCQGCGTSVITNWAATTSAYIKSLDPNHMVCIGDEGFGLDGGSDTSYPYTTDPGLNFTANLAIPTIDFGTFHLYPSSWGESDSWAPSWITAHAKAAAPYGKPIILEEYGSNTHTNEESWQATVLSTQTAGDMFWQYGDTISSGQTANDGYTIYYGTSEYTAVVSNHAAAMLAKAV
ncbi:glycoside hydrolase superfamily [Xylogone sp. PMI_703]|nr:glycoside hydrolase superfamily [Xylogone sp. PMI_703]